MVHQNQNVVTILNYRKSKMNVLLEWLWLPSSKFMRQNIRCLFVEAFESMSFTHQRSSVVSDIAVASQILCSQIQLKVAVLYFITLLDFFRVRIICLPHLVWSTQDASPLAVDDSHSIPLVTGDYCQILLHVMEDNDLLSSM